MVFSKFRGRLIALATAAALAACAGGQSHAQSAAAAPPAKAGPPHYVPPDDPYPSTYHPYPSTPTAITGATVYDGEGGRIENGTVLMVDGRIQAVGGPDTPIPEGATRIDGHGLWGAPG